MKTLVKTGKVSLYNTTNNQYGACWVSDGIRNSDLSKENVPTYTEIVNSMNHFKKTQKLIKNRILHQQLSTRQPPHPPKNCQKFPITDSSSLKYPQHSLSIGPSIYHTNNMNYGRQIPTNQQLPHKFFPCNSQFTKGFNGGNFQFNGLNTVVSRVTHALNDM